MVKEGKNIRELMQVCYDVEDYDTKMRETKALLKASNKLTCKNLKMITWDYEGKETMDGKRIVYDPLWKWLLGRT